MFTDPRIFKSPYESRGDSDICPGATDIEPSSSSRMTVMQLQLAPKIEIAPNTESAPVAAVAPAVVVVVVVVVVIVVVVVVVGQSVAVLDVQEGTFLQHASADAEAGVIKDLLGRDDLEVSREVHGTIEEDGPLQKKLSTSQSKMTTLTTGLRAPLSEITWQDCLMRMYPCSSSTCAGAAKHET